MGSRESTKRRLSRILSNPLKYPVSIIKTLYFNLNYFPLRIAVRCPVIIYRGVRLESMRGRVELAFSPVKPGNVQIGKRRYGFQTKHHTTIWEQRGGTVIFGKDILIGKGTFIMTGEHAVLKFGRHVNFGGNDKVICRKSIVIGENTVAAWDVQIIDTDFHPTINTVFNTINCAEKPVTIGKHNWLGFGSTILKGSVTPDHCIVSANTTIRHDHSSAGENIVLGNEPDVKVTAKYVRFDIDLTGDPPGVHDPGHVLHMKGKRPGKMKDCG